MKKTKTKGTEEMRVKKVDIASVVDGAGRDLFGVGSSSERGFVSVEDSL